MRTKAESALAQPYHEQKNFGDLTTADHKVLSEGCESRNNHRYAVVVQDSWIKSYPCKNQNFTRKHKGACKSSWSQIGSLKSFTVSRAENLGDCITADHKVFDEGCESTRFGNSMDSIISVNNKNFSGNRTLRGLFHRLVLEVVSPAHLVCPTCSWHPVPFQISPSNPRISVTVLGGHWASLAVVRSKWVHSSLQQQPLVACLSSLPRSIKASIPCM